MGVRRVLAGIVALALVSGGGSAAESRPTACTFSAEFTLVPGLSLTPSSGEFTSGGQTGEIACDGPVEGNLPAGNFGAGRYGTDGPDDCQSPGDGDGVQSFTMPLAHGSLHMTNRITFTDGILAAGGLILRPLRGGAVLGHLRDHTDRGRLRHRPVTRVWLKGKGTFHD
jgi:hypothetical protein